MVKTALITGITGQDGSYLAELLLSKGYAVHGIVRRASNFNTQRIDDIFDQLHLHYGDLLDAGCLHRLISEIRPDEVYNLAAQSHVRTSFDQPVYTAEVVAIGTLKLLEAVRSHENASGGKIRVYQAASSELFGDSPPPQNEDTPMRPRSPYACAKLAAYWHARNYREAYGMFIANGILFNHESPRRGETFVTRKVTRAASRIAYGLQDILHLGNLDAVRDWGYAGDHVEAMWRMLQAESPDDYVVATGESHSVRELADRAFRYVGLDWRAHVTSDPCYFRPTEVDALCGDPSKISRELDWKPLVTFGELVDLMMKSDLELARREKILAEAA